MTLEDCIFCKIAHGDVPSWKILENDTSLVILDNNPIAEGHSLIIPKRHVRYWEDLTCTETAKIFNMAKTVAKRIKKVFGPDFVCVFIRGGRVKHAHIVLFPSHEGDRLSGFPQSVL
jgi:histidine triad (HIT) family protein